VYNSCGDRHCPLCVGAKRADWLTSKSELLLPGIKYFQVVFTIPDKLSSLALGNRREIYNLLFHSASVCEKVRWQLSSNHHRQRYISECRDLLTAAGLAAIPEVAATLPMAVEQNGDEPEEIDRRAPCCPTCKAKMRCIAAERRRSSKLVMRSHYRPHWYSAG
jgi:hypothetical protein